MIPNSFFDLQLFADGAAAASGSEGVDVAVGGSADTTAEETVLRTKRGTVIKSSIKPNAEVKADEEPNKAADKDSAQVESADKKSFDDLLGDEEYKREHNKRIEEAVKRRHKDYNGIKEENEKLNQLRRYLAVELGVDYDDLDGIVAKAEEGRKNAIHKKAVESGNDEELIAREEENSFKAKSYEEQLDLMKADVFNARIDREMTEAKEIYPDIDFGTECKNPAFKTLISNGFSVKNAYESVHINDIIAGAMADAAQKTKQKLANDTASGVQRPSEGGMSKSSTAQIARSPKDMSREERASIRDRVRRGERVIL